MNRAQRRKDKSVTRKLAGETKLYRHYDENGCLLYVGISKDPVRRMQQHSYSAEWYGKVASVKVETFKTRAEAEIAEKKAINDEAPAHNITHSGINSRAQTCNGFGSFFRDLDDACLKVGLPQKFMHSVIFGYADAPSSCGECEMFLDPFKGAIGLGRCRLLLISVFQSQRACKVFDDLAMPDFLIERMAQTYLKHLSREDIDDAMRQDITA